MVLLSSQQNVRTHECCGESTGQSRDSYRGSETATHPGKARLKSAWADSPVGGLTLAYVMGVLDRVLRIGPQPEVPVLGSDQNGAIWRLLHLKLASAGASAVAHLRTIASRQHAPKPTVC
jgi:hypothetical protein